MSDLYSPEEVNAALAVARLLVEGKDKELAEARKERDQWEATARRRMDLVREMQECRNRDRDYIRRVERELGDLRPKPGDVIPVYNQSRPRHPWYRKLLGH